MELTTPAALADIIAKTDAKTPVGSAMRTAEWAALPAGLRDGAVFSASVESARYAQAIKDGVADMVKRARSTGANGEPMWKMDRAKLVRDLRQLGEQLGIQHPDNARGGSIKDKDLRDPLAVARLKLVVNTQMEMAYGHGEYITATSPAILNEWPCWELVRISPRAVPRNWLVRWREAGGTMHGGGRMIALKTSPVWRAISRFGNPFPPFDFNSGMGIEEIGRDEAEQLGLVKAGETITADPARDFRESLKASITGLDEDSKQFLKEQLGARVEFVGDEVRWTDPAKLPDEGRVDPMPIIKRRAIKPKPAPAPAPKPTPQPPPPAPMPPLPPAVKRTIDDVHAELDAVRVEHDAALAEFIRARDDEAKLKFEGTPTAEQWDAAAERKRRALARFNEAREKARDVVSIKAGERGTVQVTSGNPAVVKHWNEGRSIVERYVHASIMPKIGILITKLGTRACCNLESIMEIPPNEFPSTIAHEIAHAIEYQFPAILKASQDFLLSRRRPKEKPVNLKKLYPHLKYKPHERTIEDEWTKRGGDAYSGKVYHPGSKLKIFRDAWTANMMADPVNAFSKIYATELLTMGIERLHADPLKFAAEDREYFNYVVSTLNQLKP